MSKFLSIFAILVLLSVVLCDEKCGYGWEYSEKSEDYSQTINGKVNNYLQVISYCKSNHAATYGRGGGYPWKFGDSLNLKAAKKRCEKSNPQGCEKNGEIYYPKCAEGFKAKTCCICEFDSCPNNYYIEKSGQFYETRTCYTVSLISK